MALASAVLRDDEFVSEGELVRLVEHRGSVQVDRTVEEVGEYFRVHDREYAAVTHGDQVVGVCSRSHIRSLVSGRYGFALHSRTAIRTHLLAHHLVFDEDTPLGDVLSAALSRAGDDFYQDVVLVDALGRLIGLISTESLVRAQSAFVTHQIRVVESQRLELTDVNRSLSQALAQHRELERRLVQEEKAMLVRTLAGGIAHEINNKLLPISGYAELLTLELAPLDNPRLDDYCSMIRDSAFESARIIGQLLQLARPLPAERTSADLGTLVRDGLTLVNLRLKESSTELHLDLPTDPVPVLADAGQIKQLVMNLVLNALDAMADLPSRRLVVRLGGSESVATLSITDVGHGIRGEHLTRVFDPFFTTKRPDKGTGLGLSVCLAIARQHGGDIQVESTPGVGTTFHVQVPMEAGLAVEVPLVTSAVEEAAASCAGLRVLVVEDDDAVAEFIEQAIDTGLECRVTRAANGRDATRRLEGGDFALVISDVRMPEMNGIEFAEWVQGHAPSLMPRLVLMTGDASDSDLNLRAEQLGVHILRKPFTLAALLASCRNLLCQRPAAPLPERTETPPGRFLISGRRSRE